MSFELVLRGCRVKDGAPLTDIGISDGQIAAIAPLLPKGRAELEVGGRVVLPGLIDAHTHLDKTLLDRLVNESGTLLEAIELWRGVRGSLPREDYVQRALGGVRLAMAAGTTAIRTHADVGTNLGLTAVEALLEVKERCRGKIDVQIVALGHKADAAGPREAELVEEAVRLGVDCVGGAPHIDEDPKASIDFFLDLAEKYGKPVDLHMDERDDPTILTLEYLAEQTIARGLQGRVTADHCCSLSACDHATAERIMDKVAAAQIHVITLPSCNLYLQGRGDRGLIRRGLTRVKELLARGVNVVTASDNVQDPFNPLGKGDPLLIGNLTCHAAHMGGVQEQATVLEMLTTRAARCLGLSDYGLAEGCKADLVVLDCTRLRDVLALLPTRLYVIKAGRVVAATHCEQRVELD